MQGTKREKGEEEEKIRMENPHQKKASVGNILLKDDDDRSYFRQTRDIERLNEPEGFKDFGEEEKEWTDDEEAMEESNERGGWSRFGA